MITNSKNIVALLSLALICIVALPLSSAAQNASIKIGVIDVQKVVRLSDMGKATAAKLTEFIEQKNAELQGKEAALTKDQNELLQQQAVLETSAFNRRKNDIEKRALALRQEKEAVQGELEKMQADEQTRFTQFLGPVIQDIGKAQGFTIILERRSGVYYHDEAIEITDAVIQAMNVKYASEKK